ncbi:hypothetical protein J6590_037775, partial [Homalodisca vitripennis]
MNRKCKSDKTRPSCAKLAGPVWVSVRVEMAVSGRAAVVLWSWPLVVLCWPSPSPLLRPHHLLYNATTDLFHRTAR